MAVSRGDLEIGDDRTTTGKSPPIATDRESRFSQDSSVVECDKPKGKIVNTKENNVGTGRLVVAGTDEIQGRDSTANETSTNKSFPPVRDKTSKNSKTAKSELLADKTRTFHAGIKEAKSFRKDDAYECSTVGEQRVSVDFGAVRIKKVKRVKTRRRKAENKEGSISARVIYKLVGTAANNNNNKKQRLEHSSQNHANLIVVDATIPSCATSRELAADSCRVDLGWPTTKTGRSSNVDEELGQRTRNCENCGGLRRKCCGVVECEGSAQEEEERGANGRELGRKHERLVPGSLCRSRSLPRLSVHDSGVACSGNEHSPAAGHPRNSKQQLAADLRQLHTLKQHYYPEGGWGWVVLFVGMLVQMLSHGVHGSSGILLRQVADKFGQRVYLETG